MILQLETYFKQKFPELDAGFTLVKETCVYIWVLIRRFFLIQVIRQ